MAQSVVTITFDLRFNKATKGFTEEFLTKNFHYFEAGLSEGRARPGERSFMEGSTQHFFLENITSKAFTRIITYIEKRTRLGIDHREGLGYRPEVVDDLLKAVIAADYLGLKDFDKFEKYLAERLAFSIAMNRLRLTPDVLLLVVDHRAFRSGIFWDVLVKAAVRVLLRVDGEHQLERAKRIELLNAFTADDQLGKCDWTEIRAHYRKLKIMFPWYKDAVEVAAAQTLSLREENPRWPAPRIIHCNDPLFEYTCAVCPASPRARFMTQLVSSWIDWASVKTFAEEIWPGYHDKYSLQEFVARYGARHGG